LKRRATRNIEILSATSTKRARFCVSVGHARKTNETTGNISGEVDHNDNLESLIRESPAASTTNRYRGNERRQPGW